MLHIVLPSHVEDRGSEGTLSVVIAKCVSYWLCISNQSVITISMTQIFNYHNEFYVSVTRTLILLLEQYFFNA